MENSNYNIPPGTTIDFIARQGHARSVKVSHFAGYTSMHVHDDIENSGHTYTLVANDLAGW